MVWRFIFLLSGAHRAGLEQPTPSSWSVRARGERLCPHHRKQDGLAPKPTCPELLPTARLARTRAASPPSPPSSSAPRATVRRGRGSCGLSPTFPVTGRASMGLCRVCPGYWPFRMDPPCPAHFLLRDLLREGIPGMSIQKNPISKGQAEDAKLSSRGDRGPTVPGKCQASRMGSGTRPPRLSVSPSQAGGHAPCGLGADRF